MDDYVKVHIFDFRISEPDALGRALSRLRQFEHVDFANIYCTERKPDGWLEYILQIKYASGGSITIGCIERNVGEQMEFHS